MRFKLVHNWVLPKDSFLDRGDVYDVNCVFQIWVKENTCYDILPDMRIKERPSIVCDDFKLWQYNATDSQFKVVHEDWEFAVYRQGYKDYTKIFTQADKKQVMSEMSGSSTGKRVQFFFMKPLNEEARRDVYKIDFLELANLNTSTPGFGKADFVEYYRKTKTNQ